MAAVRRRRTALLTAVAAAATTSALSVGAHAAPVPAADPADPLEGARVQTAAVNPTSTWQKLSAGGVLATDKPSVARVGSALVVVWHRQDTAATQSVRSRTVSAAGAPGAAAAVVSGWPYLTSYPQVLTSAATGPTVVLGGRRSLAAGEAFNGQLAAARLSAGRWVLSPSSFSQSTGAANSFGIAAVPYAGSVLSGFTLSSLLAFHVGSDAGHPASVADLLVPEPAGPTAFFPSLAAGPGGSVWAAWYDLSNGGALGGTRYVQVRPTTGTPASVPGSADPSGNALQPDQRVPLVGGTGGPWVAYPYGYPSARAVRLFNLVTHRTVTVPGSGGAVVIVLAPGPGGRLWVTWETGDGRVRATRSNPAVTRFEPVVAVRTPGPSAGLAGDGTPGPLDLVVTSATSPTSFQYEQFYRRILPNLTVTPTYRAGRATVTVTDAGAAIGRAVVTFGKTRVLTGGTGVASVPVGTAKGVRVITVSRGGYAVATIKLKV